ncbi:Tyrosine kinase domain protein [Ceratobasidium sp. AG-Ba]|nr:Tyrosine kinase domain protein [Ceratobasidium sp. AG-Ba]
MSKPHVPTELKSIRPFLQHADEFRIRDPIISYWCEYHAVKTGMELGPREKESLLYLSSLLKSLEATRRALRDHEAIANNGVGYLYVKDFAGRKFNQVDEEDRRGATSRSTAKRFLRVTRLFDILSIFDGVKQGQDLRMDDKRMYAKQRASEISRALRDNRTPPRPPHDSRIILPLPDSPRSDDSRTSRTYTILSTPSLSQSEVSHGQQDVSSPASHNDDSSIRISSPINPEESDLEPEAEDQANSRRQPKKTVHPGIPEESQTPSVTLTPRARVSKSHASRSQSQASLQISPQASFPSIDEQEFADIISPMPTISSLLATESTLVKPSHIISWCKTVLDLVSRTELADPDVSGLRPATSTSLLELASVAIGHITTVASLWSLDSVNRVPLHVAEALYLRGTLRANGAFREKVAHNPEAAYRDFEAAAKLGYVAGWFRLGKALENSNRIQDARALFEYGAKLKEPNCLYRLGKACLLGELDMSVDLLRGMELLKEAANLSTIDCPHPAYIFGIILMGEFPRVTLPPTVIAQVLSKPEPDSSLVSLSEARLFIKRSAYLGFGPALYRMGRVYAYAEIGYNYDPELSVKYYLAASQRGVNEANMGLSKWYLRGSEGAFDKDEDLAVAFAKKAANGGSTLGMFTMGYYYEMGVGVGIDRAEAIKWYAKAAAQGDAEASGRLAKLRETFSEISGLLNLQSPDKLSAKIASSRMSLQEMFNSLLTHGCTDLSSQVDLNAKSHIAVSGGAFGDVYCGKLRDGTPVAIKAIRHHMLVRETAPKALKRAMREIYTWSKVKHNNVQELMGVIVFQGCLGMVSLWMENGNLEEYLRKNPTVDRHNLCTQVARGVSYLHNMEMVHGDLKARNVLVGPNGVLKLSDFDHSILSKCSLAFTETTNVGGGTLRWMAPELFSATDEEDPPSNATRTMQTDVYALAMTMLEIVTGRLPYSEYKVDGGVIMALHQQKLPKRPRELLSQDRLWALLVACWNQDPHARPTASSVYRTLSKRVS